MGPFLSIFLKPSDEYSNTSGYFDMKSEKNNKHYTVCQQTTFRLLKVTRAAMQTVGYQAKQQLSSLPSTPTTTILGLPLTCKWSFT